MVAKDVFAATLEVQILDLDQRRTICNRYVHNTHAKLIRFKCNSLIAKLCIELYLLVTSNKRDGIHRLHCGRKLVENT